jgi:hypothetical protein
MERLDTSMGQKKEEGKGMQVVPLDRVWRKVSECGHEHLYSQVKPWGMVIVCAYCPYIETVTA